MASDLGDPDGVRRLAHALLAAGRGVAGVTNDLSGHVKSLVPSGWSGGSAEGFTSGWDGNADKAQQLAAVCTHVGRVLLELSGDLESADRQASSALQNTGGPTGARFGDPVAQRQSAQELSRATGTADQARAAARAKLAGINVPRIGPPLTASQVNTWASRGAPGRVPLFGRLTGDISDEVRNFARRTGLDAAWGAAENERVTGLETVGQEAHFTEGIVNGLTGMLRGIADLVPGPAGGLGRWLWGDPSAAHSWEGLYHLAAPFLAQGDPAAPSAFEGFGTDFVAWHEWHSDPARAAGNVVFNVLSLFAGTKFLRLRDGSPSDAGKTTSGDEQGGELSADVDPLSPGPPPPSFTRPATGPPPLASIDDLSGSFRSNFTAIGDSFGENVRLAGRVDGYHDVIVHGSGTDFGPTPDAWARGTNFSHRVLAKLIKHDPNYPGGPIRLIACSKAEGATAAQNLADKLGVEILAANDTVWAFPGGHLVVGPTPFAPMGGWDHFYPGKGG